MKDRKKKIKKVTAALLTHINKGETSFTPEELEEELSVKRDDIDQTLEWLQEEGLFSASDEEDEIYTFVADIGELRDFYLAIDQKTFRPASKQDLGRIRIPEKYRQMCTFGQRHRNHRLPPIVDVSDMTPDLPDINKLEDWLSDVDPEEFEDVFDAEFGDDDEE